MSIKTKLLIINNKIVEKIYDILNENYEKSSTYSIGHKKNL